MIEKKEIYESGEDYLEAILMLSQTLDRVRAIDIVHKLGYSKPSVSIAMKNLKAKGFVEVIRNTITLTPKGLEIAEKMYERHKWVSEFFKTLGVLEDIATSDACKLEHHFSDETFNTLKKYFSNTEKLKNYIDSY